MTAARPRAPAEPTPAPPAAFATVRQAAAYSSLGERTIRRLIAGGQLPAHKVGARVVVAYSDLDALIAGGPG